MIIPEWSQFFFYYFRLLASARRPSPVRNQE